MNLEQLRYFERVAACGSFTKAADALYITKGGLTYQVKQMERELGFELFDRDSHHLELTPQGSALLPAVREMLATWDTALARACSDTPDTRLTLHVGLAQFMDEALLGRVDAEFRRRVPGGSVRPYHSRPFDPSGFLDGLLKGGLDVAFMTQREVGAARSVAFLPLCPLYYGCLVAPGHRLAAREALAWSDLDGETLALLAGARRTENRTLMLDTQALFGQRCPAIRIAYTDTTESMRYMVEHDGVVGILPYTCRASLDPGRLELRVVADETEAFGLAWASRRQNPVRDVYVQVCREAF